MDDEMTTLAGSIRSYHIRRRTPHTTSQLTLTAASRARCAVHVHHDTTRVIFVLGIAAWSIMLVVEMVKEAVVEALNEKIFLAVWFSATSFITTTDIQCPLFLAVVTAPYRDHCGAALG